MKKMSLVLMSLLMFGTLTGCGAKNPSQSEPASVTETTSAAKDDSGQEQATEESPLKVALLPTVAGLGDQAFNDAVYDGVKKYCDDKGIELTIVEPKEIQDFSTNCIMLGQDNYDLVFICENSINEILKEVAPQFPETHYVITEGNVEGIDNVTSLQFKTDDVAFLCGAFMVEMSKALDSGTEVAWVGGINNPLSQSSQFGTQAGAAYMGGSCSEIYVGSYNDAAKAKEIGLQLYNKGISIIATMAGGSNAGVFQAAESFPTGKYAMGAATGQFNLSPSTIIASNVKALDTYCYSVCEKFFAGQLASGIIVGGFEEQAVELRYSSDPSFEGVVPDSVKEKMEEIKQKLISGEIDAPSTEEEYKTFLSSLS